jgi:hypothetical protein
MRGLGGSDTVGNRAQVGRMGAALAEPRGRLARFRPWSLFVGRRCLYVDVAKSRLGAGVA